MRYKLFGKSGLRVSEICLGTMTFGTEFGWGNTKRECRRIFDRFVDAGGNFIDTANYYTRGTSEKMVGDFITKSRRSLVVATKYSLSTDPSDPNGSGNHRKNMVQALEASLQRLKTDYVDILWLHAWDGLTPIEEVMRAFDDMVRAGKVLYVGFSDTPAWVVSRAATLAEGRGWTPVAGLQLEYSLAERTIEREFFPMARQLDMAIMAWSPLAMGVLTGKYLEHNAPRRNKRRFDVNAQWGKEYLTDSKERIVEAVVSIAGETRHSPAQVALNWIRQQREVVIPIVGAKTAAQVADSLGCLEWTLTAEHMQQLDEVSRPEMGFPQEFLSRPGVRNIVLGDKASLIVNHRTLS